MPKVEFSPTHLQIKLNPGEKIWGMHGDFKIPGGAIRGAEPLDKTFWRTLGLRIPGTAFPGLIIAGTYLWRKDRAWVYWLRGQEVVQINLAPGFGYTRILIGTENAQALADEINDALTAC